ncbi:hypothetical protein A8A54_04435 [Brucella pseudogrignonensis]|uniref:hypothetical protein n=1 Tax=Brucella pseudogrignonensis TaxID=419475 RepID=UPI0007DA741E|nr:hypothetical protein [Brucella pseudogrignonensis]ANG95799.1 hypothetical protein A8A54_04435 [Brucella pseudogrignonensis]
MSKIPVRNIRIIEISEPNDTYPSRYIAFDFKGRNAAETLYFDGTLCTDEEDSNLFGTFYTDADVHEIWKQLNAWLAKNPQENRMPIYYPPAA